ncbi:hypothetical protein FV217_02690 [Methylobacterium sp. WL9]|nr:hypothetical protein FV217_02690 [Methylobacterium sp. WL9]
MNKHCRSWSEVAQSVAPNGVRKREMAGTAVSLVQVVSPAGDDTQPRLRSVRAGALRLRHAGDLQPDHAACQATLRKAHRHKSGFWAYIDDV